MKLKNGIIQIYTGDGKGKTTASIGLALRAAGSGLNVVFIQFLKDGKFKSGEVARLKAAEGIEYIKFAENAPIFDKNIDMDKLKDRVASDINKTFALVYSGLFDLVIMDEFIHLITLKLVKEDEIIEMMKRKPKGTELVLTGRGASKKLIDFADLVTEMKAVKHPYESGKGMKARKGIEY